MAFCARALEATVSMLRERTGMEPGTESFWNISGGRRSGARVKAEIGDRTTPRSMTFLSSRILPGQEYFTNRSIVSGEIVVDPFPYLPRVVDKKECQDLRDIRLALAQRRYVEW